MIDIPKNTLDVAEVHIHLYDRKSKAKKHDNDFKICVVMYGSSNDFGTWLRKLKALGVKTACETRRNMTDSERSQEELAWRLHFIRYKTWYGLIRDEWRCTKNREWIEELIALAKDEKIDMADILAVDTDREKLEPQQLQMFQRPQEQTEIF